MRKKRKTVNIPEELHKAVKIEAVKKGLQIEDIVSVSLKKYLTRSKKRR